MKTIGFLLCLFICQFGFAQIYFDGSAHQKIGPTDLNVSGGTMTLVSQNLNEESGVDILLGQAKGFGFTFTSIDQVESPNGAYQKWNMIGTVDGVADQLLWSETHEVNNQNGLLRTDIFLDTSPMGATQNQIRVWKNDSLVLETMLDVGLMYTREIDTLVASVAAIYCDPIVAKWDATCFRIDTSRFIRNFLIADGSSVSADSTDEIIIETFALNPTVSPSFCSKVENRTKQSFFNQILDEGVILFDNRIPFYALGDVVYTTFLDSLRIEQFSDLREGVRIPLEQVNSIDLDWKPISSTTSSVEFRISSQGNLDGTTQRLGEIWQSATGISNQYQLGADFQEIDASPKLIQIYQAGNLVQSLSNFQENEIGMVNQLPTGCGKLAFPLDSLPFITTVCYYMSYPSATNFEIEGQIISGDEIRILSETTRDLAYLSEFTVEWEGIPELVILGVQPLSTSNENEIERSSPFTLFPNPTSEHLHIQWESVGFSEVNFAIVNAQGQLVLDGELTTPLASLDLGLLSPGAYVVRLTQGTYVFQQKILKLR